MVLPSEEEGVLAGLKPKNIPVKRLTINPEKVCDCVTVCLAALVRDPCWATPFMGVTLICRCLLLKVR